MKLEPRRGLVAGGLLIALAAVYFVVRGGGITVTTAVVARDTLSVSIGVEGRTRARDLFTVTAPVGGRLARISLEEGMRIHDGQVIARILPSLEDPRTLEALRADAQAARAAHLEAEAALDQARARSEQARRESERRSALADEGALTRESLEQFASQARVAEMALSAAEATLEAATARRRAAEARLLGADGGPGNGLAFDVTAPVAGRILRIPDRSERVVAPGTPLVELADVLALEVVFDVLSEDAVRIEPGQEIRIREWGGEEPLSGVVRTVTLAGYTKISALGVEEQRVDVIGDLSDIPPSLGSGYRVGGDIVVWSAEDVRSVPTGAVFRSEAGWAVFAVEGGRARLRPVVLGRRNQDRAEVIEGLSEGDEVVLFPPASLEDGVPVRADRTGT
jgi:HlyD family secretion protein